MTITLLHVMLLQIVVRKSTMHNVCGTLIMSLPILAHAVKVIIAQKQRVLHQVDVRQQMGVLEEVLHMTTTK